MQTDISAKLTGEASTRASGADTREVETSISPAIDASVDIRELIDGLERTVVFRLVEGNVPVMGQPAGGARVSYVSAGIHRIFGLQPADVMTDLSNWFALVCPLDLPRVVNAQALAISRRERLDIEVPFDIQHGDINGRRVFSICASPRTLPDGQTVWDGVSTDVTDLAALHDEQARLLEVVEWSADLVGTVNSLGKIIYLNKAGHEILGMDWSDDPDRAIDDIGIETLHTAPMQQLYWDEIVPAVRKHGVWVGETEIVDRAGAVIPVSQVVVAHRGPPSSDGRRGRITHLSTIIRDLRMRVEMEREMRAARNHAETVSRELKHRLKNLFALIPAVVKVSARGANDMDDLAERICDRVAALGLSHSLTLNPANDGNAALLSDLLGGVLEPYSQKRSRVRLTGPDTRIVAADGNGLSLILHELTTNAAKYGALASVGGKLDIAWSTELPKVQGGSHWLCLNWNEFVPPRSSKGSSTDRRVGFGTELVDRLTKAQGGEVERRWSDDGLAIQLRLPLQGEQTAA